MIKSICNTVFQSCPIKTFSLPESVATAANITSVIALATLGALKFTSSTLSLTSPVFIIPFCISSLVLLAALIDHIQKWAIGSQGSKRKLSHTYDKLPTKSEFEKISYIISSLGSGSVMSLTKSQSEIVKASQLLRGLHPLRFLSTVLNDENLRKEMIKLRNHRQSWTQSMIWSRFLSDYSSKLNNQADSNNLLCYIDQFAADIKVDKSKLLPLIAQKNWEEFFNILF